MVLESRREVKSTVAGFAATHWTVIRAAARAGGGAEGTAETAAAHAAFARLCSLYWYPLYAFVRRSGHPPPDAQDLTQDFFVHLIERRTLQQADAQKGRFRSFLLTAMRNFLHDARTHRAALCRGGNLEFVPLETGSEGETRYQLETLGTASNAESFFEAQWATTLVEAALGRLRQNLVDRGKPAFFEQLKSFLNGDEDPRSYQTAAGSLGVSLGTVRITVHRLRRQYRELLREEVARTVSAADEVDGEIRYLCAILAARPD